MDTYYKSIEVRHHHFEYVKDKVKSGLCWSSSRYSKRSSSIGRR